MLNKDIWSLYLLGNYDVLTKNIHILGSPLKIEDRNNFIRLCLFENCTERAITAKLTSSLLIYSTTFYKCSHFNNSGALYLEINGFASLAFIKTCFVECTSKGSGVANVFFESTQSFDIRQCTMTGTNNPEQSDTLVVNNGIRDFREINSSDNIIIVSPLFTSCNASQSMHKMLICSKNTLTCGGIYSRLESFALCMTIFANNTHSDLKNHGLFSFYEPTASPYIAFCDFVGNSARLIYMYSPVQSKPAVFDRCFFDEKALSAPFSNAEFGINASSANKQYIWIVQKNMCRAQYTRVTCKTQTILGIAMSFVLSEVNIFHSFLYLTSFNRTKMSFDYY